MKCTTACLSPTACNGFGYCRNFNRPFKVTRLVVPPIYRTQLTGIGPEFRTIEIAARNKTGAEKIADSHPEWFDDLNAVTDRKPA